MPVFVFTFTKFITIIFSDQFQAWIVGSKVIKRNMTGALQGAKINYTCEQSNFSIMNMHYIPSHVKIMH